MTVNVAQGISAVLYSDCCKSNARQFMGNKEGRQQLPGEGDRRWPWFNRYERNSAKEI